MYNARCGKSTAPSVSGNGVFGILAGNEAPDAGTRALRKLARQAYVPQDSRFGPEDRFTPCWASRGWNADYGRPSAYQITKSVMGGVGPVAAFLMRSDPGDVDYA
jgi:hypothetical protein